MNKKKKKLKREADKLFYQVCLLKNPKCLLCGRPANQVHHFFPKSRYAHLRYELDNGISLCQACHFQLTHVDKSLSGKIVALKSKRWYNKLEKKAKQKPPPSFLNIEWYQKQIEKLKKLL